MTATRDQTLKCCCDGDSGDDYHQDLVHELSKRLDTLRRCEQYINNAHGHVATIEFWRDIHEQEADNVTRLQVLLSTVMNRQAVLAESHVLCDTGELLSISSIDFR